jgi:Amt family ammonium transporter
MLIEMVSGLLLPAGIWLIISAGTPLPAQRRLAAATLFALATALLCFVAFGFALMFGGMGALVPAFSSTLNAPIAVHGAQDTWIFAGASGFLLDAAAQPEVLALFLQALPLVLTCAVLMAGALAQQARPIAQFILIFLTCGIALPLAGCWVWANGWLSVLGAVDAGRLAVIGLVAGGAGLAWLMAIPRRSVAALPQLPETYLPARAIAGVLLSLAGMAGVLATRDTDAALRQFMNTGIAVAAALITAGAYAAFTTRNTDTLSASRAMLAALFMASTSATALPAWTVLLMGAGCGMLATAGYYWVNEKHLLNDESALVTAVLLPAVAGMLIAGVFAGPAVLVSQVIAVCAVGLTAHALTRVVLWLAALARWPVLAAPTAPAPSPDAPVSVAEPASKTGDVPDEPASVNVPDAPPVAAAKPRGVMAWLRRSEAAGESPKQPRKVAYPYRVGGRRMGSRPMGGDNPPVDSAPSIDAS